MEEAVVASSCLSVVNSPARRRSSRRLPRRRSASCDCQQQRPHPDSVLRALDILDRPPAQCVLIGDPVTDIEVSRATGLRSIGYVKTPTRGNEPHLAGADAITDLNHALAEHVRQSPATG